MINHRYLAFPLAILSSFSCYSYASESLTVNLDKQSDVSFKNVGASYLVLTQAGVLLFSENGEQWEQVGFL